MFSVSSTEVSVKIKKRDPVRALNRKEKKKNKADAMGVAVMGLLGARSKEEVINPDFE